jgi:hypothetical protein
VRGRIRRHGGPSHALGRCGLGLRRRGLRFGWLRFRERLGRVGRGLGIGVDGIELRFHGRRRGRWRRGLVELRVDQQRKLWIERRGWRRRAWPLELRRRVGVVQRLQRIRVELRSVGIGVWFGQRRGLVGRERE